MSYVLIYAGPVIRPGRGFLKKLHTDLSDAVFRLVRRYVKVVHKLYVDISEDTFIFFP